MGHRSLAVCVLVATVIRESFVSILPPQTHSRSLRSAGVTLKFPHPWPHELHGFFGSPDSEDDNETTIQAYEHIDAAGVTLRFSFDWIRASVQTRLSVGGVVLETVSHEGATSIVIDGFALFDSATEQTVCAITLTPRVEVTWSHLRRE